MKTFTDIQNGHINLLKKAESDTLTSDDMLRYIEDVKASGDNLSDVQDRSGARTLLRYWGSQVYERLGYFPNCELRPALR